MSNSNVIKCPHCGKIFFKTENDICPFCKQRLSTLPDFFKEIFKDNPFTNS